MDQSYSENDLSLSPSQILERLQVLRQLQLLQRGKLQKQRLQYQETSDNSSSITEIVSHFSNSTSYNTFRSLLQSSHDISKDSTPRQTMSDISPKVNEQDLIEGVSVLNLSQESELIATTPSLNRSKASPPPSRTEVVQSKDSSCKSSVISSKTMGPLSKKHISLDEMPILSPRKDFEALIIEKLKEDNNIPKPKSPRDSNKLSTHNKKPFLRRGAGMNRFGLKKNDLIIQNTKSLPWKQRNLNNKNLQSPLKSIIKNKNKNVDIQLMVTENSPLKINKNVQLKTKSSDITEKQMKEIRDDKEVQQIENTHKRESIDSQNKFQVVNKPVEKLIKMSKGKHSQQAGKGKTWASVLTNEQNDFLRQLKQSDYYKNFTSPAKSIVSDVSCDDNLSKLSHEREIAEQKMFDLLENKVSNESFNLENSFINRFLRRSKLEISGESTPVVMQKCLTDNPDLLHLIPDLKLRKRNGNSQSDIETCNSEYTDCCSDACSTVSSCCSCKTVDTTNNTTKHYSMQNNEKQKLAGKKNKVNIKEVDKAPKNKESQDDTVTEDNVMKTNMAEMNAKLITTSDLLKERLSELEDEIETFRKENLHLTKLREEVDLERQKFYEEKSAFEQKFNEEKILSEYYLAEEKEKLTKQKQTYESYVREMRGRLSKKDKDEVVNLKKEISDLKEEIRLKDAKSTTTTARLRNQLKIMEKEKKDLQEQVEKLKKENRRIQHSNDMTRRLTNIKYLAEINKKLTNMTSKETQSEIKLDSDIKYKSYEIERQSRSRKNELASKSTMRPRAKSVPNLKATSRYAKYFSQRDAISSIEQNQKLNTEVLDSNGSDDDIYVGNDNESINLNETDTEHDKVSSDNEDENHLEKLYMETFQSDSSKSNRSSLTNSNRNSDNHDLDILENTTANGFFIRKSSSHSNSVRSSKSPLHRSISPHLSHSNGSISNRSKSPISILINKSNGHKSPMDSLNSAEYISNLSGHSNNRTKSPIISNQSSLSQKSATVILKDHYRDKLMVVSPEPSTSKSSLSKTSLIPTEIRKPDGTKELRFPNGNIKYISADGTYSKFVYYNGDVKENFYSEGRIKYFYAETKTYHTTHADGLEVLEFPDGQVEKRYKDGSSEIRLSNGSVRYFDPKNKHVREEWRFPDGAALTVAANGEQRIVFNNGQVEVHAKDHKRREFPDGTVKLVYNDGTSETRYASGRVRIKDKHGNLIMDSATG